MSRRENGPEILYVTVDGVLQPLGYSQVGRVVLGLARRGFRYRLLSLESPRDLADAARVSELEQRFAEQGVRWTHLPYDHRGTAAAAASNLARLGQALQKALSSREVGLVHARAYHAAAVALAIRPLRSVGYLFDARGRWIDERLLGGRWFTNPWVERGARGVERQLYQNAAALVTLTQLHADDIANNDFGRYRGAPVRVVTTCADYEAFQFERGRAVRSSDAPIPAETAARLRDKLVVAFVGSTNAFYRHDESFQLAQRILQRRPDSHLLILSAQAREFSELARAQQLPESRYTIATARHEDMPYWLSRIDWAIQLLNGGTAKRGSMPTKLAEFFAAGVRPLHFGCNSEVSSWVERAGSGLVLRSLEAADLDAAADFAATTAADAGTLVAARERTRPHFDLASGLDTYASLLQELGIRPA